MRKAEMGLHQVIELKIHYQYHHQPSAFISSNCSPFLIQHPINFNQLQIPLYVFPLLLVFTLCMYYSQPNHLWTALPVCFILPILYSLHSPHSLSATHHHVHVANEAPESRGLILGHVEDRGKKVTHALNVAKVKVVHHKGHENIVQQGHIGVVFALKEWVVTVGAVDILLCLYWGWEVSFSVCTGLKKWESEKLRVWRDKKKGECFTTPLMITIHHGKNCNK